MEHGPITTNSRSSLPPMMLWIARRVPGVSDLTGVPRIGKKRIRCSGGGNTVMSLMRSSSVRLVFSTFACQVSLGGAAFVLIAVLFGCLEFREGKKKPPGFWHRRFWEVLLVCLLLRARLSSAGNREPKVAKEISAE